MQKVSPRDPVTEMNFLVRIQPEHLYLAFPSQSNGPARFVVGVCCGLTVRLEKQLAGRTQRDNLDGSLALPGAESRRVAFPAHNK